MIVQKSQRLLKRLKKAGVVVSETPSVDKGTDTNSSSLEQSKSEIKQDQDKQVKELEATTANKFKIMRPSKKRMKLFTLTINL